jgi:integral membrane protein (TIGR01906 family)
VSDRTVHGLVGALVAVSTMLVLVGVGILLFFNPLWVGFEQGRSQAAAWTGWSEAQVSETTNAVLHDMIVGPPDFAMTVGGGPVFDERERQHLADARRAFIGFGIAALAAVVALVAARWRSGGAGWFWRAVATGAAVLAVAVLAIGMFVTVSFDLAFELFHRLLFAGGTYTFDPATERLVQIFPEQFWFETAIGLGIVLVVGSAAVYWFAHRRAAARA